MITIAHFYNEIISTQEKLGGGKLRPHKNKNKNKSRKTTKEALWEAVGQNEKR